MLFSDVCYSCKYRLPDTHPEHVKAKAFWGKYRASYIYECGGFFHPLNGRNPIEFHKKRLCKLDMEILEKLNIESFRGEKF